MLDDDGIQITPQYHNFKPDLWAQRTLWLTLSFSMQSYPKLHHTLQHLKEDTVG
jgi:hypothetical protein